METYEEVMEYITEENVQFIRLAFFDVFGRQKNIAIMPGELKKAFTRGVTFDAAEIAGFGGEVRSDLFLRPDPTTFTIVPWRPLDAGVCMMFCDIYYPDGRLYERDTRYILKQAVSEARKRGISVDFGPEMEFYVFRLDENGERTDRPVDNAGYMDVGPEDGGENLRRDICFTLQDMGITPEASHHEAGPGQNEVDFRYSDPVSSADHITIFKWAVKNLAVSDGYAADFSPKPISGKPGNGMHFNISVDSDDGSDLTPAFMAGVLDHIKEITLFLNPVEQSYERLGQMEAPYYVSWSEQNRSQLIRIPAMAKGGKRFELRSPDPQANPYLSYAMVIYAGLDGIDRNLKLPAPLDVNLYVADSTITEGLEKLPLHRSEAVRDAGKSDFVKRILPETVLKEYCSL